MQIKSRSKVPIWVGDVYFESRNAAFTHYGINRKTYHSRLAGGWSSDDAMITPVGTKPNRNNWDVDSVRTLQKHALTMTAEEIGTLLGRTSKSVARKAVEEGISMVKRNENHHNAKLTNLQVAMVLTLSDAGFGVTEIHQSCFNHVSLSTINDIKFLRTRR